MKELTLPAAAGSIETVTDFVNSQLEGISCPPKSRMQIDIAIDELLGNIVQYAYPSQPGSVTVRTEIQTEPTAICITFVDEGIPYNPLEAEEPDISLSAEERDFGGLGIFIAKKTMDGIAYSRENGKNILTIRKIIT